ncbi:50S ribosomal protein L28 [Patescibacteria group bacterium]|nr:50S ribosomal protein L28 [Patescibacteria group bacterium]MBU1895306.1 50S ribosomal protein L28 [Patescibacteria group bacterium]
MSKQCDICKRSSEKGASRSHSKVKTLKRQHINIQKVDDKKVCTRCIRTAAKKAKV